MIKYRPDVHCPHIGYVIINVFGSDANFKTALREAECASNVMWVPPSPTALCFTDVFH